MNTSYHMVIVGFLKTIQSNFFLPLENRFITNKVFKFQDQFKEATNSHLEELRKDNMIDTYAFWEKWKLVINTFRNSLKQKISFCIPMATSLIITLVTKKMSSSE